MKKLISMIVPCYNEEEMIPIFYEEAAKFTATMPEVDFEFLFIDDGSHDNTLKELKKCRKLDTRVRYISFSRNFGKEAGIYAGLESCKGDFVVILDADLQHPLKYIKDMYEYVKDKEYDCASMYRTDRKNEKKIRSFFSRKFYKLMNKLSHLDIKDGATDYRMMSRLVVDSILGLKEYNRFTKGINTWVGFKTMWLPYENVERVAGETKWSFGSLIKYSIEGITSFSTTPLVFASVVGFIFCILSLLFGLFVVIKTIIYGDPVAGFPSLFCMILFMSGLLLLFLGIQGQYLAKIYMETKRRPIYIIRETEED